MYSKPLLLNHEPFKAWWHLKDHTYLKKPAADSRKFVYVCTTF